HIATVAYTAIGSLQSPRFPIQEPSKTAAVTIEPTKSNRGNGARLRLSENLRPVRRSPSHTPITNGIVTTIHTAIKVMTFTPPPYRAAVGCGRAGAALRR